jgi:hypothetical protein
MDLKEVECCGRNDKRILRDRLGAPTSEIESRFDLVDDFLLVHALQFRSSLHDLSRDCFS